MKKCPLCAEQIQDEAIKCRYCGQILDLSVLNPPKPLRIVPQSQESAKKEGVEPFLTVVQMAKILDVPKSWIYQRTQLGQEGIPHIKLGKYIRFKKSEVLEFFKAKN